MWSGPVKGEPAGCLAHPDHHRGQAGYVSLILYLTETKSIVVPSLVSRHRNKRGRKRKLGQWDALWILNFYVLQCFALEHVSCF